MSHPWRFPVHAFAIADFALSALAGIWALAFLGLLLWSIFFAEGTAQDVSLGVAGSLLLVVVGLGAAAVFAAAGVGLLRRAPWGYYTHLVGAALVALTCWGIPYSVAAILFAARPEFRAPFFRRRRLARVEEGAGGAGGGAVALAAGAAEPASGPAAPGSGAGLRGPLDR